jgi:hypothetical protein
MTQLEVPMTARAHASFNRALMAPGLALLIA